MPTNGSPAGKSMTCPGSESSRYLRTAPARTRHDALGTTLTISYIEVQSEMVESAGAGAERHAVCGPGVYRQLARAERAAATPQSCRGRCIRYGTGIQTGTQLEINRETGVYGTVEYVSATGWWLGWRAVLDRRSKMDDAMGC